MPYDNPMEPEPNPYAVVARFYDLEYADDNDDLPFYLNLARRLKGPILEVGVGTGRVAIALARAGHTVVGIDTSDEMLAIAKAKLKGALAKKVRLENADARTLKMSERFDLIIIAANSFAHFLTESDQQQALTSLKNHLSDTGPLVIALQNPYVWALDNEPDRVLLSWEKDGPGKGERTTKTFSAWPDLSRQVRHLQVWYDVVDSGLALQRYSAAMQLRWFYRFELALLLEQAHLQVEDLYGSYELEPYTDESPLLLVVAKRA